MQLDLRYTFDSSQTVEMKEAATSTITEERAVRRDGEQDRADALQPEPTTDSLQLFFNEARRYPLLTAEEEIELAQRIERGDLAAKERLINSNLRLVISIARRYQGQGLPLGDLVQEAMLGLIRAAEKFDWRRGYKFSTYAVLWIKQSIQRGLDNTGRPVRIPAHVAQRERTVNRVSGELSAQLNREPTEEEIAKKAKLPLDEVKAVRDLTRVTTSLDAPVGADGATTLRGALGQELLDLPLDRPAKQQPQDAAGIRSQRIGGAGSIGAQLLELP